jgi:hypothetical protein
VVAAEDTPRAAASVADVAVVPSVVKLQLSERKCVLHQS